MTDDQAKRRELRTKLKAAMTGEAYFNCGHDPIGGTMLPYSPGGKTLDKVIQLFDTYLAAEREEEVKGFDRILMDDKSYDTDYETLKALHKYAEERYAALQQRKGK